MYSNKYFFTSSHEADFVLRSLFSSADLGPMDIFFKKLSEYSFPKESPYSSQHGLGPQFVEAQFIMAFKAGSELLQIISQSSRTE